jgi:protein ImuA
MSTSQEKLMALRASLAAENPQAHIPLGHEAVDACLKGGLRRGVLHEVFAQTSHETAATGFAAALAARVCGIGPDESLNPALDGAPRVVARSSRGASEQHRGSGAASLSSVKKNWRGKRLLWIRQDFSALEFGELAATGLLEFGLDPGQVLLLQVGDATSALRAGGDALSCAALGAVVIEIPGDPKVLDLVASRRLTLACAQSSVTAVLLRLSAKPEASTAETRWLVRGAKSSAEEDWGNPAFEAHLLRNRSGQTGRWFMEWNCDDGLFRPARPGVVVSAPADRQDKAAAERAVA